VVFKAIRLKGFAGMIGFEPYPGIRIGKQLGELVRFYGLGGIFHSDELPDYGISIEEVNAVNRRLELVDAQDAFVIVGGSIHSVDFAIDAIIQRLKMVSYGVPAETRAATVDGKTIFSRPRAGAARMYPETDIEPIPISKHTLDMLKNKIPKSWEEIVTTLSNRYNINRKLAEQIFDSEYLDVFEEIANSTKILPTFIASIFRRLDTGLIAKESITLIFEKLLKKECRTVNEAIEELGIKPMEEQELQMIVDKILQENTSIINSKGMASAGLLMGRCMSILRGKADGRKVNLLLNQKLEQLLKSKNNIKGQTN
jgi:glutamyl-tRNA(Gln) amidotransferase subunit E